jgi:hypothetical protein
MAEKRVPDSSLPSAKSTKLPFDHAPGVTGTLLVEQAFTPSLLGEEQMNLQKIYTALLTADLAAAEGWYTKLLGRGPDYRPMDTLVQWELFDQGGVALSTDDDIAGRGRDVPYRRRCRGRAP